MYSRPTIQYKYGTLFTLFYTKQQAYIQTPIQTPLQYGFKKRETLFQDHSGIKRLHFHNMYTRGQSLHMEPTVHRQCVSLSFYERGYCYIYISHHI